MRQHCTKTRETMKKLLMTALVMGLVMASGKVWAGEHRIGGGANYWVAIDDIDNDDVDDDGFSYLASYQYWMDFLGVELDMEILPDRFGETAYAPGLSAARRHHLRSVSDKAGAIRRRLCR
jgi:hypothetical protein